MRWTAPGPGQCDLDRRRLAGFVEEVVGVQVQQVAVLAQVGQHAPVVAGELGAAATPSARSAATVSAGSSISATVGSVSSRHRVGELLVAPVEPGCAGGGRRAWCSAPSEQLELARSVHDQHLQALPGPVEKLCGGVGVESLW